MGICVKSSSGGGGPSMGRREDDGSEGEVASRKDVYLQIRIRVTSRVTVSRLSSTPEPQAQPRSQIQG
jgi:hypothetical protein